MLEKVDYRKVVAKYVDVMVVTQEIKILLFLMTIPATPLVVLAIPLLKVEFMMILNKISIT